VPLLQARDIVLKAPYVYICDPMLTVCYLCGRQNGYNMTDKMGLQVHNVVLKG
jgi:hypothetical protein